MAVNVLFLLGTVLLVARIARELWPDRERLAIGAAAFVALVPVTVRMERCFTQRRWRFLCTLALWFCVRTFADTRYAVALGVALGSAQLVHASPSGWSRRLPSRLPLRDAGARSRSPSH